MEIMESGFPVLLYRLDRVLLLRLLCLRRFNDRFVILNDLFMMGWLWGSLLVRKKKSKHLIILFLRRSLPWECLHSADLMSVCIFSGHV